MKRLLGVSALDFLARATSSLSDLEGRFPSELEDGASYEELFLRAARRCRGEGLPVRRVLWSGELPNRSRTPWEAEWLDGRWLVRTAGEELVVSGALSPGGRRSTLPTLNWWLTTTRAFDGIVSTESGRERPFRSVRFLVYREGEAGAKRPTQALQGAGRIQEIEYRHHPDGSVRLQADGFLAVVLAYFATQGSDVELQWISPAGTLEVTCRGPEGGQNASRLVVATALWWRFADFPSVFPILSWVVPWAARLCHQEAEAHPLTRMMTREAVGAYVLEARLKELYRLSRIFSEVSGAEEEVAGWCREIEAALRQGPGSGWLGPTRSPEGHKIRLSWSAANWGTPPTEAAKPYVSRRNRVSAEAFPRHDERLKAPPARLLALADGERSLAEIALHLAVECGIEWEAGVQIANRWLRERRIAGLERRLESRTLLYFSYGSCMCRPSFRETVPRFELIGEAVLKDYRLGFTHRSVVRGGGVADLVPAQGSEVHGVLYRIPRVYLRDLDEREGVLTGHYRREWVAVEALGVPFEEVLTYTVVNKASREIPPSPEYAGLIVDGARGFLSDAYVTALEAIFESLGVEPEIPL